jgi:Tfp pilus assembly protein PilN
MRPVNLIPPEDRRGERAPMRTGPLAYVIVAVLAVALIAVTLTVLAGNQISDHKADKANLQVELARAQASADRLKPYADFASVQHARQQTVATLAKSRFDWQRVLQELAIVIPSDVWLTNVSANVSGAASASESSSSSSTSSATTTIQSITGPSLDIQGCAKGHEAVARFIAALHDVDGVTRVTVLSSDRPDPSAASAAAAAGTSGSAGQGCSDRNFISEFEVVAAFDAVKLASLEQSPVPTTTTTTTPASGTTTTSSSTVASDGSASSDDQSQVADGQQQLQQQKQSAAEKTAKGRKAVSTFVPGTGSAP